ncbi:AMP-binding protein [Nocardioides guangzhouensis]|uniref:AMP-binding protein n=1 Tax=Nocardioides guangzhouensis TaxID=2497878 RepID=UPI001C377A7B|nr:AMP-binding protein [Nocardioides guangzhouensis]
MPRRTALRLPDKVGIVDGDLRLTFAAFDDLVDRTAAALVDAGLATGDRLALLSHNCWQFAVLDFATARAGVVLVPVNFMLRPEEIAFILDHSEASAFVVEAALTDVADKALAASAGSVRHRVAIGGAPSGWDDVAACSTTRPGRPTYRWRTTTRCG